MKSVFIFGAGASKSAGGPLMYEFLDKSQDLLRHKFDRIESVKDKFDDVYKSIAELQSIHAKSYLDLDNIEVLFGAIEMGNMLNTFGDRDELKITELRKSIITLIYKTLEESISFPFKEGSIYPPQPYYDFKKVLNRIRNSAPKFDKHEFSFITFNYDLCLDYTLHQINYGYHYCLNNDVTQRIPLLKLHGSINWAFSESNEIMPIDIEHMRTYRYPEKGDYYYFPVGTQISSMQNEPRTGKNIYEFPFIVPPTWNKSFDNSQLRNVWRKAASEISNAENIFVIGYSAPETDSFFRYLYALGSMSSTRIRNFVVINPDKSIENKFKEFLGQGLLNRFEFIQNTFDNSLSHIQEKLSV